MQLGLQAFRQRERSKYRLIMGITTLLGLLFVTLQWKGFNQLWASGITFAGAGAGQFLYIIAGLHAFHVIGGMVALIIMFLRALSKKRRNYDVVPVEVMATYWHFVDLLWVYLMVFFLLMQ